MIFLSELLRQSVYDVSERRVGTLRDICVALHETFPIVTALVIHPATGSGELIIPWSQVYSIEEAPLHLAAQQSELTTYEPHADELLLKRDILDKQIVDTQGFRVVKVNDLKLAQIKKTARLIGVDISFSGLARRLGLQTAIDVLGRVLPIHLSERTVTWNYVEPIQVTHAATGKTGQLTPVLAGVGAGTSGVVSKVQLNVSQSKLADLWPADIADILEQLDIEDAGAMLDRLDPETAADTLNEVEYALQSELLSELGPERASDLLEHLAPDDAADILADMSHSEAERLLNLMPSTESQPIRDLLRYPAETAGGIMTNAFLAQPQAATAEEVLIYLRQHSSHLEMIYYLFIMDDEQRLVGVVSLRQLVTAEPTLRMQDLMSRDIIKVRVDADQEEVARVIAKYDLLAVPVVDATNHLLGLVTVDDVIDVIHEEHAEDYSEMAGTSVEESDEDEKTFSLRTALSRFSWQAVNVCAGFILALMLLQAFQPFFAGISAFALVSGILPGLSTRTLMGEMISLVPMLLLTAGCIGSQALAIAGWELRTRHGEVFLSIFMRELLHGTVGGVLSSILTGLLTWLLFHTPVLALVVALSTGLTLFVAAICGMVLPNLLQHLRLRGSWITGPLLDPVIAIVSLSIFLTTMLALINNLPI